MVHIEGIRIYRLTNAKSNTVLDLYSHDNRSVKCYPNYNRSNQAWLFDSAPGHQTYYIKSVNSHLFLALAGDPKDGQKVVVSPSPFAWYIKDDSNALGIYVPNTNYCLDLAGSGDPKPGTHCQVWKHWGGQNQLWKLSMFQ